MESYYWATYSKQKNKITAMITYPIHETFFAFQGEGIHMGRAAFFIRLFGCPLHCPWCDSAGTWHPNHVPKSIIRETGRGLAEMVPNEAEFVVVTGGEPCIHNLYELTEEIRNTGIPIHLETSGAFPITGKFDWITLSPKRAKDPVASALELADEFKFIVEHPEDIGFHLNQIRKRTFSSKRKPSIWLHPEWGHREDPAVLNTISHAVKTGVEGFRFRAGYQIHKLYKVDFLDMRTRPPVPLGGDTQRGY